MPHWEKVNNNDSDIKSDQDIDSDNDSESDAGQKSLTGRGRGNNPLDKAIDQTRVVLPGPW